MKDEAKRHRRRKIFISLQQLNPLLEDHGQAEVEVKALSRRFYFYPSSDTWYSEAKDRYGFDCESLIRKILHRSTTSS